MCGIFGVIGNKPIAESIYFGIIQLQHRGQDAAGIFTYDPFTDKYATHKDRGLVTQVFNTDNLPLPNATWGIGHVRYSTIGTGRKEDTQPLYVHGPNTVAMAHNGNIVNYSHLRKELEEQGVTFESTCDIEVILHTFARELPKSPPTFEDILSAVATIHKKVTGSYSVIAIIAGVGMVAFRDPRGIRPLLHGVSLDNESHAFGSETNSLAAFNFKQIKDVGPGQVIFVNKDGKVSKNTVTKAPAAYCSFEWNYFSKPNTVIGGKEVYQVRANLGRTLAKKIKDANLQLDAVVPIPTSARASAIALAEALKTHYEEGFVKQDNIGRTFIMPTQMVRQQALKRKLSTVESVFQGKNVILVDDSIVRGTVSKRVIALARQAGAKNVYFASTFPPIRHPCVYGIDFPDEKQLIAGTKSIKEIAEEIDADDLFYNTIEDLKEAIGTDSICAGCITGNYPTCTKAFADFQKMRTDDLKEVGLTCKT